MRIKYHILYYEYSETLLNHLLFDDRKAFSKLGKYHYINLKWLYSYLLNAVTELKYCLVKFMLEMYFEMCLLSKEI